MDKPQQTVDQYIELYPEETQTILKKIREMGRKAVPDADEMISYGIPTFKKDGKYVFYYAGYKNHVSIYPISNLQLSVLKDELAPYVTGKGTAQFPLDKPVPYDLIKKMIDLWVDSHKERTAAKKK